MRGEEIKEERHRDARGKLIASAPHLHCAGGIRRFGIERSEVVLHALVPERRV